MNLSAIISFLRGLRDELVRPATAIAFCIAIITTAVSIIVSVYFYYKSERRGILYYSVDQLIAFDQRRVEIDTNNSENPLIVVDKDGNKIIDNVYVANMKIWNGGNTEISSESMREPLQVTVRGLASNVNISISSATNNNSDRFEIGKQATISWNHFDVNDGIRLRVIYASKDQLPIQISGRFADVSGPLDANDIKNRQMNVVFFVTAATVTIMMFFGSTKEAINFIRSANNDKVARLKDLTKTIILNIIGFVFVLIGIMFVIYIITMFWKVPSSPL